MFVFDLKLGYKVGKCPFNLSCAPFLKKYALLTTNRTTCPQQRQVSVTRVDMIYFATKLCDTLSSPSPPREALFCHGEVPIVAGKLFAFDVLIWRTALIDH